MSYGLTSNETSLLLYIAFYPDVHIYFFKVAKKTDPKKSHCRETSMEEHVCRVINNSNALHVIDESSGRYSVLIPMQELSPTSEKGDFCQHKIDVDLTFGCLNTCMGMEYSLRIWNLVFTLETE